MGQRVAVEIGGSKIQAALGDQAGHIQTTRRVKARPEQGHEGILRQIREVAQPLLSAQVERIAFGFGGPVDVHTGRTVKSHQVAGWDGFPLADWGKETFGLPCVVENDTNCGGLAEALLGAGRCGRCVFYSNLGSGIGGAIILDGRLHNGRFGAGEVGHTYIWDRRNERYEIVEHLCSGWALDKRARQLAETGQAPRLLELSGGKPEAIDARLLAKALEGAKLEAGLDQASIEQAGIDDAALQEAERLLHELTSNYAVALANVVALINPDRIVIGGGVSLIGQVLFDHLESYLRRYCFAPYRDNWQLLPAELGEEVVLAGALMI